jgi:hypothetical protein
MRAGYFDILYLHNRLRPVDISITRPMRSRVRVIGKLSDANRRITLCLRHRQSLFSCVQYPMSYFNPNTSSTDFTSLYAAVKKENGGHIAALADAEETVKTDNAKFRTRPNEQWWISSANMAMFIVYYLLLLTLAYRLYFSHMSVMVKLSILAGLILFPIFAIDAEAGMYNCAIFAYASIMGTVYVPFRAI